MSSSFNLPQNPRLISFLPRRTKTYVAFDGDSDYMNYLTFLAWSADKRHPFSLNDAHDINEARDDSKTESINKQLKERLDASKNFVLLISSKTHLNRKGCLQYEISYALRKKLPIILVFIGYSSEDKLSEEVWQNKMFPLIPVSLRGYDGEKYCLVCPFSRDTMTTAIYKFSNNNLPDKGYTSWWNERLPRFAPIQAPARPINPIRLAIKKIQPDPIQEAVEKARMREETLKRLLNRFEDNSK